MSISTNSNKMESKSNKTETNSDEMEEKGKTDIAIWQHNEKVIKQNNTHNMSIDKLLQFCISNYGLLLYFSFTWIWNF